MSDLSRTTNLTWTKVWQLGPFIERAVTCEVSKLVNTCSFGLLKGVFLFTFSTFICFTLPFESGFDDIVVFAHTLYFAEKSQAWGHWSCCKWLEWFLEQISFFFAQTNASPCKDLTIFHQVLNKADCSSLFRHVTLFIWLRLSKILSASLFIILGSNCLLSSTPLIFNTQPFFKFFFVILLH